MKIKQLKNFTLYFLSIVLLLSFVLPQINNTTYLAATVAKSTTETTKRKTVGHKIEGAEYYEELWDKFSVIAIDNGGGSGEGGGAGDKDASNAGNSGAYSDAGGTFGQAAGQGLGTGNTANQSGTGSGTTGKTTGSVKADALRSLKARIEESRAESIQKVIETAKNAESVLASIAERESIQNSIQKSLQQESIKAKIVQAETQKQYETPVYIEETIRFVETSAARDETHSPTSAARETASNEDRVMPTSRLIEQIEESSIRPTPRQIEIYDSYEEKVETRVLSEFEPGDFVTMTNARNRITNNIEQTIVNSPTSEKVEETMLESTMEIFDHPIVEEESTIVETETSGIKEETKEAENKDVAETEEGKGSKGGQDAEKEEDMTGDDGKNESQGHADNKGQYQLETKGEHAGKKIFELDRNGNLGLDPEHLSVTNMRGLVTAVLTLLFLLGALTFVLSTKDNSKKNNYF